MENTWNIKLKPVKINGQKVKYHPIRLLKGYFPADPEWPTMPNQRETPVKAQRGTVIYLPVEEARKVIDQDIGERADEIPL